MPLTIRLVLGLALLSTTACKKSDKAPAEPPAVTGSAATHAAPSTPPPAATAHEGYPADFPFLDGGTIDPTYKPELMAGEVSSVLVAYPNASVMSLSADLTAKAKSMGWRCMDDGATRPPIKLECAKGSATVTVMAKDHPAGGVALFVNVP